MQWKKKKKKKERKKNTTDINQKDLVIMKKTGEEKGRWVRWWVGQNQVILRHQKFTFP